jgi:hypothetical protein
MSTYLRALDLKVLVLALVACFAVPWLVVGTISGLLTKDLGSSAETAYTLVMLAFFLLPPVLAGYFTARYSRQLPQLHVALVTALGLLSSVLWIRGLWLVYLVYGLAFVLLSALGAFIRLRAVSNAG